MIDHHVHLGIDPKTGFSLDAKTLSNKLDLFGIEKTIIFACPNQKTQVNPYKSSNEEVLKASYQDCRFIPFMFIHPLLDRLDYLEKNLKNFLGFKIYSEATEMQYSYLSLSDKKTTDLIAESSKPVIFHTGFKEGSRIKDLIWILERKSSPVVFVHSGRLIDEDLKKASQYENVFMDVSPLVTMLEGDFLQTQKREITI